MIIPVKVYFNVVEFDHFKNESSMEIPDDYEQLTKPIPMYGVVVKKTVPVAGFEPASTIHLWHVTFSEVFIPSYAIRDTYLKWQII